MTLSYLLLAASGIVATEFVFHHLAGHGTIDAGRLAGAWTFVTLSGLLFGLVLLRQFAAAHRSEAALDETNAALRVVNEVMVVPAGPFDLDQLLEEMLERLCAALHSESGTIYLTTEDRGLVPRATISVRSGPPSPVGRSLAESVARSRRRVTGEADREVNDGTPGVTLAAGPLTSGDDLVGVIVIGYSDRPTYSELDMSLLERVAERLAAAVERDRLMERERRSRLAAERARGLLAVLNQAADALAPAVESYDAALASLVGHVVPAFADWFAVDLLDGPHGALRAVADGGTERPQHLETEQLRREFPDWNDFLTGVMAGSVAHLAYSPATGRPVAGPAHPPMMSRLGATSYLVVPVRVRGLSFGTLSFATLVGRRGFRPSDIPPAEALAERVAVTIERVMTYREAREAERSARRQTVHLRRLMEAAQAVNAAPLSESDVLSVVAEQSRLVTAAGRAEVVISDGESSLRWACSPLPADGVANQKLSSLHRQVTTNNRPARWNPDANLPVGAAPSEAWMAAPLTTAAGDNRGSVVVTRPETAFTADEESVLISLAQLASVALDKVRLYREVQEGQSRLVALVDSSPVAIVELTLAGEPVSWNRTARDLLIWPDVPPAPGFGEGIESGTDNFVELWKRTARGESVPATDRALRRPDGTVVEVSVSTAPLRGSEGTVTGVLAVMEDVSARRQVEEQLNRTERMDAMGRLAGAVAHDFNNLLTVILGYNDLLARRLEESSPLQEEVASVRNAAQRAAELTNQLLDIGRQQVASPQPVNLARMLATMEAVLRRLLKDGAVLEINVEEGVHLVVMDPTRLERVVLNLVINAADAMGSDGTLRISTDTVEVDRDRSGPPAGHYVRLVVQDTGSGMDAYTLEHCFDPFFTTKDRTKGTGLGLAAVYGIVTQSEGQITVESEPGVGTTFRVLLPRALEAEVEAEPSTGRSASVRGKERILLVEDQEDVRRLADNELTRNGYTVVSVPDAPAAIFTAEEEGPFDLLVTDVAMPGMSGPELVRQLGPGAMPVLYVSGHVDAAQRRDLSAEADLLPKPFTPQALLERVRQALDRAQDSKR